MPPGMPLLMGFRYTGGAAERCCRPARTWTQHWISTEHTDCNVPHIHRSVCTNSTKDHRGEPSQVVARHLPDQAGQLRGSARIPVTLITYLHVANSLRLPQELRFEGCRPVWPDELCQQAATVRDAEEASKGGQHLAKGRFEKLSSSDRSSHGVVCL
jgi:hypothetical protein